MKSNSKCWQFFTKKHVGGEELATCKKCGVNYKYKGSTTILSLHIKNKHKEMDMSDSVSVTSSSSTGVEKFFPRSVPSRLKEKLDEEIALFFATSYTSIRAVENVHLTRFGELLSYTLPSRRTLMRWIHSKSEEISLNLTGRLEHATHLCFTSDCWTAQNATLSVLSVTVHFYEPESFIRQNLVLDLVCLKGSHAGHTIAENIERTVPLSSMSLSNFIVCDGASNMNRACDILGKKRIHCLAHKLNLCVQSALRLEPIAGYLMTIRTFIKKIKRSSRLREKLKVQCEALSLNSGEPYNDCAIRWNSSYKMMKHFLDKKAAYDSLMFDEKVLVINVYGTSLLGKVCDVLQVFDATTLQASKTEENMGIFLGMYHMLKFRMRGFRENELFNEAAEFIEEIDNSIDKYFADVISDETYKLAAFFDPRLAYLNSILPDNEWRELESRLEDNIVVTEHVDKQPTPPRQELWNYFLQDSSSVPENIHELNQYRLTLTTARPPIDCSVDKWWEMHAACFPTLGTMAKKYLVTPASSVDSERLFSILGIYYGNRRRVKLSNKSTRAFVLISANEKKVKEKTWSLTDLTVVDTSSEESLVDIIEYTSDDSDDESTEFSVEL